MNPLDRWLTGQALPGARIVHNRPLTGGYRNENRLVITESGERFVLRRYRHGNACAVEAALAARIPAAVPVPEVVAADPDGALAGEPVLLSRFAGGTMVSRVLADMRPDEAGQLGQVVGRVLGAVGECTFAVPGSFAGGDLAPQPMDDPGVEAFVADCLTRRHPDHWLSESEVAGVRRLAAAAGKCLDDVPPERRLVHADFNPKNLLARREPAGWAVTAVVDWEFAFSGSPLFDVGNMLRFDVDYPPGYADGFLAGFQRAGGHLPECWRAACRALDLYALAEFLTRPGNDVSRRGVALLRSSSASPLLP